MKRISPVILFFLIVCISNGKPVHAEEKSYTDGVYVGEHSFVKVRVTVEEGSMAAIDILSHGGGGEKYEEMIEPLTEKIIAEQSLQVDAITGATVSSNHLKKAVEKALRANPREDSDKKRARQE